MNKTMRRTAWMIVWGLPVVAASWGLSEPYLSDDEIIVRLGRYVGPWVLVLPLMSGLLALLMGGKARIASFWAVPAFVICAQPFLGLFSLSNTAHSVERDEIVVLSFNSYGLRSDPKEVAELIAAAMPMIAVLQEVREPNAILDSLNRLAGDAKFNMAASGQSIVFSQSPVEPQPKIGNTQHVIVRLPSEFVHIWNVHLPKILAEESVQDRAVTRLLAAVEQFSGASIIAGDFNTTQLNDTYKKLRQSLHNAHEEAGFGFGFSFPAPGRRMGLLMPFVRIDHIFYSQELQASAAWTLRDYAGSDHFPVAARLSFR